MLKNEHLEDWITSNFPAFETKAAMEAESEKRQYDLSKSEIKAHRKLGSKLYECNEDEPCGDASCPVCFREYRKQIIYDILQSIGNKKDYCIITIIFYSDAMTDDDVTKSNVLNIKNKLYQQLYRIGFKDPIVGSIEIDFHTDIEKWMPHFHLLVKKDHEKIELLEKYSHRKNNLNTRDGVIDKPMKVQDLEDPIEQLSYLFKSYAKEIRSYINDEGKRRTKPYRLTECRHQLYLYIRSILKHTGIMFTYGSNKCK